MHYIPSRIPTGKYVQNLDPAAEEAMRLVLHVQSNFLVMSPLTTAGRFPHILLEFNLDENKNSTPFHEDNFQSASLEQSPEYHNIFKKSAYQVAQHVGVHKNVPTVLAQTTTLERT